MELSCLWFLAFEDLNLFRNRVQWRRGLKRLWVQGFSNLGAGSGRVYPVVLLTFNLHHLSDPTAILTSCCALEPVPKRRWWSQLEFLNEDDVNYQICGVVVLHRNTPLDSSPTSQL